MRQWERGVPGPPDRVYIDIIRHYNNSRDTCIHDLKPTPIREALTQLGYKEWRSFAERISNRLQNVPVAQLSPTTIRQFSKLFGLIQPVFVIVKERRYVVYSLRHATHLLCCAWNEIENQIGDYFVLENQQQHAHPYVFCIQPPN